MTVSNDKEGILKLISEEGPHRARARFLPNVDIYLKVEEHQEHEGEDADRDEAEPVERDRVGWVLAELGHVEVGSETGGVRKNLRTPGKMSSGVQEVFCPPQHDAYPLKRG